MPIYTHTKSISLPWPTQMLADLFAFPCCSNPNKQLPTAWNKVEVTPPVNLVNQSGNYKDDHNHLYLHSSHCPCSLKPLQRDAPIALFQTCFFFFLHLLPETSSWACLSYTELEMVCVFPSGLNLYLFLLNITPF